MKADIDRLRIAVEPVKVLTVFTYVPGTETTFAFKGKEKLTMRVIGGSLTG